MSGVPLPPRRWQLMIQQKLLSRLYNVCLSLLFRYKDTESVASVTEELLCLTTAQGCQISINSSKVGVVLVADSH